MSPIADDLLEVVDALMPRVSLVGARLVEGGMHDVVLIPGVAAIRISQRPTAAEALPRRTEQLRVIADSGLPFAVPEPLTPVTMFGDRAAVAVSWISGSPWPDGYGDPAGIAELLRSLRELPITPELRAVLPAPSYEASDNWAVILADEVIPRLPPKWRDEGRRRLDDALALETVPHALVHGDLQGTNVHWGDDGRPIGVIDWDRAHLFDPAVDAAFMGWHGKDNVRRAVDSTTYRRARVWDRTFGITHLVAVLVLDGMPLPHVDSYVKHIVDWLERGTDSELL